MKKSIIKKITILFLLSAFNFIIISSAYSLLTFTASYNFKALGFEPSISEISIPITGMYPGSTFTVYEALISTNSNNFSLEVTALGELFNQQNKPNPVPFELKCYINNQLCNSLSLTSNSVNQNITIPSYDKFNFRVDVIWPENKPYKDYKSLDGSLIFEITISQ